MATEMNFSSMSFDDLFQFVDSKLTQKALDKSIFESMDFVETSYRYMTNAIAVNQRTINDPKLLIKTLRICKANSKANALALDMLKQSGIGLTRNSKATYGYVIFYSKDSTEEKRITAVNGYKQISAEVALGDLRCAKKAEKVAKALNGLNPTDIIKNLNKSIFENLLQARQTNQISHEMTIEILNAIKSRLSQVEQSSLNF